MATLTKQKVLTLEELIGQDLLLPIDGNFKPVKGLNLLLQDIQQLLLTVPGERVMRPTYGCTIRNQIWENIDAAAANGTGAIKSALALYEPRITVTDVSSTINRNTDLIIFNIKFFIKNTDTSLNLLFPLRSSSQIANA